MPHWAPELGSTRSGSALRRSCTTSACHVEGSPSFSQEFWPRHTTSVSMPTTSRPQWCSRGPFGAPACPWRSFWRNTLQPSRVNCCLATTLAGRSQCPSFCFSPRRWKLVKNLGASECGSYLVCTAFPGFCLLPTLLHVTLGEGIVNMVALNACPGLQLGCIDEQLLHISMGVILFSWARYMRMNPAI